MQLIALGLNHTTAPVEIREKISFATDTLSNALHALTQCELAKEAVIVSTCNRTEIYCSVEQDNVVALYDWLARYHALTRDKIQHYLYTHTDHEAVRHLLRVACGLDSMILGEP